MLGEAVERDDPIVREALANSVEHLEDAVLGKRRAIDPSNTLGIVPLTIGNAKARFVAPIVLSFRS
jgi:hypothetical protein